MPVKKWYTVYEAANDELLTIGTAKECAKNLDFSEKIFYEMVAKVKVGANKRYIIAVEEINDEYEETDGNIQIYGESNFDLEASRKCKINDMEAFSLYMLGKNDKEIGEQLHVTRSAIKKWRERKGLKSYSGRGRQRKRRD